VKRQSLLLAEECLAVILVHDKEFAKQYQTRSDVSCAPLTIQDETRSGLPSDAVSHVISADLTERNGHNRG